MHDDSHIARSLQDAAPDTQPPAEFDVDRIIRQGRRLRRRNRLAVGGAATTGVIAAAGAIALVLTLSPGTSAPPADDPTPTAVEDEETSLDPEAVAMAGYPWTDDWNHGMDDGPGSSLAEAATASFGPLLLDAGLWTDEEFRPDCWDLLDPETEGVECGDAGSLLFMGTEQRPGNYGQVFTRHHTADVWGDQYAIEHPVFNLDVVLPGGWTTEPGPVTDMVFPKHLISDDAYYTDQAPEFESETLEDGRTVMTADHGCALDLVVTYPNGTALRLSWEIGCQPGTDGMYPVELDALTEAALEMPEIGYDASELKPVDQLWDVPAGWPADPGWETDGAADANEAAEGVHEVLTERYPGATLDSVSPTENGVPYRGATFLHAYRFGGTLPQTAPVDGQELQLGYEMRYYLPGGWLPGLGVGSIGAPHLAVCRTEESDDGEVFYSEDCEEFEQDGRKVITELELPDGNFRVTVFSEEGWAASVWIGSASGADMTMDEVVDTMLALPAPPYDPEATPQVPGQ